MKQLLILILFASLIGCDNQNTATTISDKDSSLFKKVYAEIQLAKNDLKRAVSLRDSTLIKDKIKLLCLVDTLQTDLKSAHLDQLKLIEVEHRVQVLQASNKHLISRINILNRQLSELNETNIYISDSLKNTRISLYRASYERDSYKKAVKFQIAHVQIKAWGYAKSFLRKSKLIETELAKQTNYIEVTFDVVANEKLAKTTYVVNVRIRGVNGRGINKDVLVHFMGTEQDNLSVKFDDPQEFQVGCHHADITLNDENLYSGTIYLK